MAKKNPMKGKYLMLFVNDNFIPLSTSCELDETVGMVDPETKDDSLYQSLDPDSRRWTVTFDCQLDDQSALIGTMQDIYASNNPASIIFGKASNASDGVVPEGGWTSGTSGLSGECHLTSLKISAPVGGKVTVNGQFTGSGALSKITSSTSAG